MKKVHRRAMLLLLLIGLLAGGTLLFCLRYVSQGSDWAAFAANDHAYTDGRLSVGQILDRSGIPLYDAETDEYSADRLMRLATLHLVGDSDNNIATSVKSALQRELVGFDPLMGTIDGGNKVYLTIDAELQMTAYDALDGRSGTVAVYNYKTGEVLCMVSTPTFDPQNPPDIKDGDSRYEGVYLNRCLSAAYTPSSVFKIVTTAAALERIDDIEQRTFTCKGRMKVGDDTVTCPNVHGTMDLGEAFARSCNCAYAELALELGGETLRHYAETGDLLSSHSVNGIETVAGSFTIGEEGDLAWSGVGQYDTLINPCSFMTLMGAIADGGSAAEPRLLLRQTTMSNFPAASPGKTSTGTLWSASTCAQLRKMMANNVAVTYGQAQFGDLAVCAKSGTAEVGSGQPHAWFTGFIDDNDCPLAFVVVMEHGGSGADTAGAVAATVLQQAAEITTDREEEFCPSWPRKRFTFPKFHYCITGSFCFGAGYSCSPPPSMSTTAFWRQGMVRSSSDSSRIPIFWGLSG